MWFEKIAGLVAVQIALSVLLAVVLWRLSARLRREQHLAFWSLSWAVTAVYVTSLATYVVAHEPAGANSALLTRIALLGVALGWCQPACMILATWSLRSGRVGRRAILLAFGVAFLLGIVWSMGGWIPSADSFRRLQFLASPRTGFSGWLTIVSSLTFSAHLLLVSLADAGIPVYGDPNGLLNSTVATILPMGITLGIAISVLEQAEHSEGSVRSIWESSVAMRLTDPEGYMVRANPAFCALIGRPRERLEGRLFTECYDLSRAGQLLERYCARFASRTVEPRLRRSFQRWDGKVLEAELTNAFVQSPSSRTRRR